MVYGSFSAIALTVFAARHEYFRGPASILGHRVAMGVPLLKTIISPTKEWMASSLYIPYNKASFGEIYSTIKMTREPRTSYLVNMTGY